MADRIVKITDELYNVRGSFKIAKLVDIGTQCTLVRRPSGSWVLLDAYTMTGDVLDQVMALTADGADLEAVIHTHPFHTIHVKRTAETFPHARQYGTVRHVKKAPQLSWEPERTETAACHELFADTFRFSVPAGVDFVPANENLHFASVLVFHAPSKVLHVDDTLMHNKLPLVGGLSFHPTLKKVLQPRPGAAAEFRAWCDDLVERCEAVEQVLPAHIHMPVRQPPGVVADQVRAAIAKVRKVVDAHEAKHG